MITTAKDTHMPSPASPRPSRILAATAAAGMLLTAVGCSNSTTASAPPSASATASPSRSAATSASASPTPTKPATPLAVGATWQWEAPSDKVSGSATVVGYQQDVAHDAPSPEKTFGAESHGYVWAALEVKVCSDASSAKTITVSNYPWKLAYDDGSLVKPSDTGYGQFPQPEFPSGDEELAASRCIAGKIVFPVPGAKKPARAVYAPSGLKTPTEWNLQ
ncbi:hypothetical protein GCM10010441_40370 [Kitasatospora paracochleata]|uniref:DUF4352 domain-containing protein n=1 Tax=Kitasatospora paracochleata TaxID=58354 RepID=A0ABT1IW02_9ACTN|nr:hypothetical protein [Kitasatospora paracochleata]MCP2309244.1 hypothetical protein [Kitasatospora paracochleata]